MDKKKPINLWFLESKRQALENLARANGMSSSGLVRFLTEKAMSDPEKFGLLPVKEVELR